MRIVLTCLCFVALAAPAAAQERDRTPQVLDEVYACAELSGESERLACYDAAVGRLQQATTSGNVVAVDRAAAQEIEREAFGFSLPSLPRIFGNGDEDVPSTPEMDLEIASVVRRANGPATFTMTNGQVWDQVGTDSSSNVRTGGAVTIRRAALGSFLMSVEAGGRAIRVRRRE